MDYGGADREWTNLRKRQIKDVPHIYPDMCQILKELKKSGPDSLGQPGLILNQMGKIRTQSTDKI